MLRRRLGPIVTAPFVTAAFASAVALGGCGGSAPKPEVNAAVAQSAVASVSKGPKIRVATGQFQELEAAKNLMEQMGLKGVGPIISEQMTTALTQTGRVIVLERAQIDKVIGNAKLEKEGDNAKYFAQETTAASGQLKGVQAMLVGVVTQYEPNISGGGGGLDIPGLGSLKYHEDKAVVGIEVRLVDAATGKVLLAAPGKAEILAQGAGASGTYHGIGVNAGAYQRTPLGEATRQAAKSALEGLTAKLESLPWEGGVIDARGPDKVFLDAGADVDLQPGARFRVVHRGEAIKGPDGAVMGYDDAEAGLVEVTQVQDKMSVAKVVEGEGPKAGDRVRFLPSAK
jgi:curli biogenesis system outer membrane secretion channel CsgG